MRKILLALLVVFTTAGVSFAGCMPTIVEIPNGNSLVKTFIVGLQVDDEGGISSISDLTVKGPCAQLFFGDVVPTPDMTYASFLGENAILDTHILNTTLASYGDGITVVGAGWTETCDDSDPAGVGAGGVGSLVLVNGPTTIAINSAPADLDAIEFAQVVVPVGGRVTISGLYTSAIAANAGLPMVPFSFTVPVPEPSTVVLLICSVMGLVGFRRRK